MVEWCERFDLLVLPRHLIVQESDPSRLSPIHSTQELESILRNFLQADRLALLEFKRSVSVQSLRKTLVSCSARSSVDRMYMLSG